MSEDHTASQTRPSSPQMAMGEAAKHTPGPWSYIHDTCRICTERGEAEYIIHGPDGGAHGQFSHEPDARLIAAAPELLAAVRLCVQRIERPNLSPDANVVIERALAAIAKATGEPS